MKKEIEVGCAIIHKKGKILIAQRLPGDSFGGLWEFPGGKREADESMEGCLVREVREELALEIIPTKFLCRSTHPYIDKTIHLFFYICEWVTGHPVRHECFDFKWLSRDELMNHQFPRGDLEILKELKTHWHSYFQRDRV